MSGVYTPFWWKVAIIAVWFGCAHLVNIGYTPLTFGWAMLVTILAPLKDKYEHQEPDDECMCGDPMKPHGNVFDTGHYPVSRRAYLDRPNKI